MKQNARARPMSMNEITSDGDGKGDGKGDGDDDGSGLRSFGHYQQTA